MNDLIQSEEFEKEVNNYNDIVNNVVGIIFVTLSLGALGTDNPQATGILLLPIAIGVFNYMNTYYPKSIRTLEEMTKNKIYIGEKKELKQIIKNYKKSAFSIRILFSKNIIYIFGTTGYFAITLIHGIGMSIKTGAWLSSLSHIFI